MNEEFFAKLVIEAMTLDAKLHSLSPEQWAAIFKNIMKRKNSLE